VRALQAARDNGVARVDAVVGEYFDDPAQQAVGARYLRDNIKYHLGADERAGLELFYRYAREAGVVGSIAALDFYEG
jgi:predicted solute-binding protein